MQHQDFAISDVAVGIVEAFVLRMSREHTAPDRSQCYFVMYKMCSELTELEIYKLLYM